MWLGLLPKGTSQVFFLLRCRHTTITKAITNKQNLVINIAPSFCSTFFPELRE